MNQALASRTEPSVKRSLDAARRGRRADQSGRGSPQRLRVLRRDPRQRLLDQARAGEQAERDILVSFDLLGQVTAPGAEVVDPGFDREDLRTHRRDRDLRAPAVVHQRLHRHPRPGAVLRATVEHVRGNGVGAVGVDVRLDHGTLTDHALRRKAPLIYLRPHAFDHHTPQERLRPVRRCLRRLRSSYGHARAARGGPAASRRLLAHGLATVGVWIVAFVTGHIG
jgi:hypothetical protein